MSALFPHAAYAEDQPLAKTILAAHVGYRGFQSGAVVGIPIGIVQSLRSRRALHSVTAGSMPTSIIRPTLGRFVVSSIGTGAVVGTVSMVLILPFYMRGKEEIEWQDRSWRLLANEGQVEVDNWSIGGSVAGLASLLATPPKSVPGNPSWRMMVGRVGMGNLMGVLGYMAWRYGIHGGQRTGADTEGS